MSTLEARLAAGRENRKVPVTSMGAAQLRAQLEKERQGVVDAEKDLERRRERVATLEQQVKHAEAEVEVAGAHAHIAKLNLATANQGQSSDEIFMNPVAQFAKVGTRKMPVTPRGGSSPCTPGGGEIGRLVGQISGSGGDEEARARAACTLRDMAESEEHEAAIVKAGAVSHLVALVRDGGAKSKEAAAGALARLAANADNDEAISSSGAVAPLVALLQGGDAAGKEAAAGALWNLAENDANAAALASAGAVAPLVSLLTSGGPTAKEAAAGTLCYLAKDAADAIGEAGGVAPLVALLREGTEAAKEEAAAALHNLGANDAASKAGMVELGAIKALEEAQRQNSCAESGVESSLLQNIGAALSVLRAPVDVD